MSCLPSNWIIYWSHERFNKQGYSRIKYVTKYNFGLIMTIACLCKIFDCVPASGVTFISATIQNGGQFTDL